MGPGPHVPVSGSGADPLAAPTAVDPGADPVGADAVADLRRRSVHGVTTVLLRGIGIRALGLVGSVALARLLLPSDFGVLAFGLTLVAVGAFLTDAGLAAGLVRAETPPTRRQLAAMLGLQLALTVVVVGVAAVPLWRSGLSGQVAAVMLVGLVPGAFRVPAVIQLERKLEFGPIAIAEIAEALLYLLLSVGLVLAGYGVWGVVVATLVRPLLGVVILQRAVQLRVLRPGGHWREVAPLLVYGLTFQASGLLVLVRDQGVNVATVALADTATLGLWALAQRVMLVPFLLFESLWRVSFPAMSRLLEAGHDVRDDINRALRSGGILTGLTLVPLTASSPVLVPSVFGDAWDPIVIVVPLASAGLLVSGPLSAVSVGYLNAVGKARLVAIAQAATILPWLVLLPTLLPSMGVGAHGVAWFAACLVDAVVLGVALARGTRVPVVRSMLPSTVSAVLAGGVAYALVADAPSTLTVGVGAAAASVTGYLVLVLLLDRAAALDLWRVGRRLATSYRG